MSTPPSCISSAEELRSKFNDLVEPMLGATRAAALVRMVEDLDKLDRADRLLAETVRGSGPAA